MDYSLPGSSVYGILQARILEWVAISFSRGSKGFSVVNEAEVDIFLELHCFLCDPAIVGNLISGSSASSKLSLYVWKCLVQVLSIPL